MDEVVDTVIVEILVPPVGAAQRYRGVASGADRERQGVGTSRHGEARLWG